LFGDLSFSARDFLDVSKAHIRRWLARVRAGDCGNGSIREGLAFERVEDAGGFRRVSKSLDEPLFGRCTIALSEVEQGQIHVGAFVAGLEFNGLIQIPGGFGVTILKNV
jgi:hypothetical protein